MTKVFITKGKVINYLLSSIANAHKVSSGLRGMEERGFTEQGMSAFNDFLLWESIG